MSDTIKILVNYWECTECRKTAAQYVSSDIKAFEAVEGGCEHKPLLWDFIPVSEKFPALTAVLEREKASNSL